jgi:hypothetical protein
VPHRAHAGQRRLRATLAALQQDRPLDELIAGSARDHAAFMRQRAAALLH